MPLTYTDLFLSSLIALISILRRPMSGEANGMQLEGILRNGYRYKSSRRSNVDTTGDASQADAPLEEGR